MLTKSPVYYIIGRIISNIIYHLALRKFLRALSKKKLEKFRKNAVFLLTYVNKSDRIVKRIISDNMFKT